MLVTKPIWKWLFVKMLIFHIFMVNTLKTPFYDMKIIKVFKWFSHMIQIMWNHMRDG